MLTPSAKQKILHMEAQMQQAVIGQSYSDQACLTDTLPCLLAAVHQCLHMLRCQH